jgi:hypothetical protein
MLLPTDDTTLVVRSAVEAAGGRAFDNTQAALLGSSVKPIRAARDIRRASFALVMVLPVVKSPPLQITHDYPQIATLVTSMDDFCHLGRAASTRQPLTLRARVACPMER